MELPIRLADGGDLLIGHRPAAPAGTGMVMVRGGALFLDPTAPDDPPHLTVHDLDEAAAVLDLLYGSAVVEAAAQVADGAVREPVPAESGPVAAALRELGTLRWLERRSPDRLPAGLLDLGIGVAAAALDDLLDAAESGDAERRLLRRAGLVTALSRQLRDATGGAPAGLAKLIDAALPAVAAVLPFDSPDRRDLVHEVELADAVAALGGGRRLDWSELAALAEIGDRTLAGAQRAGDDEDEERTASVDWDQVPRHVLDTGEDTVTWTLTRRDPGVPLVTVAVRAAAGASPAAHLAFRLYGAGLPFPLAVGQLIPTPAGDAYTGSAPLLGSAADPLVLDVHDVRLERPPRRGADRIAAQAVRWTARTVTALRLAGPAGGADEVVRGDVQQAARMFRQAGARSADPARAARQRARCIALLRAVLARGGPGVAREAQRLAAREGAAAGSVLDVDVAPPDLSGPGWSATAAELALGAGPDWDLR